MPKPKIITLTKRATSPFLVAIPSQITHFDARIYVVVKRKPGLDLPHKKYGQNVRLDPVSFDWCSKLFTINIPLDINIGISSIEDIEEDWFDSVQAALLMFMVNTLS